MCLIGVARKIRSKKSGGWGISQAANKNKLPKLRGVGLDAQTSDILEATHKALNASNPTLAKKLLVMHGTGLPHAPAISNSVSLATLEKQDYLNYSAGPPSLEYNQ